MKTAENLIKLGLSLLLSDFKKMIFGVERFTNMTYLSIIFEVLAFYKYGAYLGNLWF